MLQENYRVRILLDLQEIDALDDLLDLYLDGEFNEKGVNRDALLQIQDQVGEVMLAVNRHLGFTDKNTERGVKEYLM